MLIFQCNVYEEAPSGRELSAKLTEGACGRITCFLFKMLFHPLDIRMTSLYNSAMKCVFILKT